MAFYFEKSLYGFIHADVGYDRNKQKSYCLLKVIVRQLVKIKGYRCCQEKMLKYEEKLNM